MARFARPLIDLDLGRALSYGYRWPPGPVTVTHGPPSTLTVAVVRILAEGRTLTTDALAAQLGITSQERTRLWTALGTLTRRGHVERAPMLGRSRSCRWRLAPARTRPEV